MSRVAATGVIRPTLAWTASYLVIGSALACGGVSREEVSRSAAPDRRVDAVLVETNGGATTSFGYEVHVVGPGAPFGSSEASAARLYAAARSDSAFGATLRWHSPSELRVEFTTSRWAELARPAVTVAGRTVRVALDSGVVDHTAPSGGMLWNRQGRPR